MYKYVIALYMRLSIDDRRVESVSIETQKKILHAYVDSMEIPNAEIIEFIDNGYTGTNFERPKVQELLELVKSFRINCIREIELAEYQAAKQECNQKLQSIQQLYDKSVDETEQMKFAAKTKAETIQLAKDISKENGFTQTLSDMLIDKVVVFPDKHLEISWKIQDFCRTVQE